MGAIAVLTSPAIDASRSSASTAPRAGCGDSVGIFKIAAGAYAIFTSSLPAFPQAGGLTLMV
jgi:hypothetical protein